MTIEDRCKLLIKKGYTYDKNSGIIFNIKGLPIIRKDAYEYILLSVRYKSKKYNVKGHQFAFFYIYGKVVECIDHKDRCRYNNKIDNLREVTISQNGHNRTGVKGYDYRPDLTKKYRVRLNKQGINIYTDYFNTPKEARLAYLEAKEKYHLI